MIDPWGTIHSHPEQLAGNNNLSEFNEFSLCLTSLIEISFVQIYQNRIFQTKLATCNFSTFPILSQSLIASSIEPGLLGEGGSAMPVRALAPALLSPPEVALEPPILGPGPTLLRPATATADMMTWRGDGRREVRSLLGGERTELCPAQCLCLSEIQVFFVWWKRHWKL